MSDCVQLLQLLLPVRNLPTLVILELTYRVALMLQYDLGWSGGLPLRSYIFLQFNYFRMTCMKNVKSTVAMPMYTVTFPGVFSLIFNRVGRQGLPYTYYIYVVKRWDQELIINSCWDVYYLSFKNRCGN